LWQRAAAPAPWQRLFPRCVVGRASPAYFFQRLAFGLHPDVAVPAEHLPAHVAGDLHDRLVAGARLRKLRDQRVPVIVPAAADAGLAPALGVQPD
jgi:hypothetical protein